MSAIDLFAGLGGFSEGARMAGIPVRWAANHWSVAVDTHQRNHPEAAHHCQDLHQADWSKVPAHDVLLASPACQGHTKARGKERPHHDATRSTAWAVVSAVEYHRPALCIVENVVEFRSWALFPAWCSAMHALGYAVAPHVLDAADAGVPQHRKRLFLICTRSQHPLHLEVEIKPHVAAASFINFEAGSWSPISKPGRAVATLARVARGRAAFGDRFVMPYYGGGSGLTGRSLARPIGTITTVDRWAIVDGNKMRMLDRHENKRAMSFRDDYLIPDDHRLAVHMLGNAVPPLLAADVIQAACARL
ncbi:DNA cytosine methyltransferase [Xanthomonas campestris pv. campestris]|nr:DNA cytosine methyltransferase [Xanthomonas campestris pv. campestris]